MSLLIGPTVALIKPYHILKLSKKRGNSTSSYSASALATVQLGLGTASVFSHSSELTATISQELVMGQALDEPGADVIPLIITKILEVGTITASLYK